MSELLKGLLPASLRFMSMVFMGCGICALNVHSAQAADLPHVVMLMADDIGWSDIGAYREQQGLAPAIPTPNIDRLARNGMLFTDAHSPASLCAPTRFCMITGSYPYRNGTQWGTWSIEGSPAVTANRKHATVAEVARNAGYRSAFLGKMHLGGRPRDSDGNVTSDETKIDFGKKVWGFPTSYGFDYSFVIHCGIQNSPYLYFENDKFAPIESWRPADNSSVKRWDLGDYVGPNGTGNIPKNNRGARGDKDWDSSRVGIDLSKKAVGFIDDHLVNHPDQPFMLYYCSQAIHVPHTPPIDFDPKSDGTPQDPVGEPVRGASGGGLTADMVYELDLQVGKIISKLEDPNRDGDLSDSILGDTLFFFTSDNGGLSNTGPDWGISGYDSTGVLRGWKGSIWEGGHRVPFIAAWGDGSAAGSKIEPGAVSGQLVCAHDWVATIYALAGQSAPDNQAMDAVNLLPELLGRQSESDPLREFMFHQSRAAPGGGSADTFAIRKGDYVLFLNSSKNPIHLYNLADDIEQNYNLIDDDSQQWRITEMKKLYREYDGESEPRSTPPHQARSSVAVPQGTIPFFVEDFGNLPTNQPDNVKSSWPGAWFLNNVDGDDLGQWDEYSEDASVSHGSGSVLASGLRLGWAGDRCAVRWYSGQAIDLSEDYLLSGDWEVVATYNPSDYLSGERGFHARVIQFSRDGDRIAVLADQHIDPATPQEGDSGSFSLRVNAGDLESAEVPASDRLGIEFFRNGEDWPGQGGANDRYLVGNVVFGYADDDRDGIPNGYERSSGLDQSDPADAELDPDEDGSVNRDEYLAGTDQDDPADKFAIELKTDPLSGFIGIRFPRVRRMRRYSVEGCNDLSDPDSWTFVDEFDAVETDSESPFTHWQKPEVSKRFYRVKIDPLH